MTVIDGFIAKVSAQREPVPIKLLKLLITVHDGEAVHVIAHPWPFVTVLDQLAYFLGTL